MSRSESSSLASIAGSMLKSFQIRRCCKSSFGIDLAVSRVGRCLHERTTDWDVRGTVPTGDSV